MNDLLSQDYDIVLSALHNAVSSVEKANLIAAAQSLKVAQHVLSRLIDAQSTELIALAKANGQVQVIKPRPKAKPATPKARKARGIFAQLEEEMPG